jgi:hypothetical protein
MGSRHRNTPANHHSTNREAAATPSGDRKRIKLSAWVGIGVAIFVMVPALYRLATEPPAWPEIIFVSIGAGLIVFHLTRVIRIRRR